MHRTRALASFLANFRRHLCRAATPCLLTTALLLILVAPAWCAAPIDNEVKAAFVIRFTEFIDWPDQDDPQRRPLGICVLGEHPVEPILERLSTDYTVKGRSIVVRRVDDAAAAAACHVVFVPDTQSARLPALGRALRGKPVLLIGNGPGLASAGAAINLFRSGSRLRFEINPGAIETAGLKASSRLLKLAVIRE